MIANIAGGNQLTCPWRAFGDPVCADVINAFSYFESGQISLALGSDPPSHIMRGLTVYMNARNAAQADGMDRARKQRAAKGKK